LHIVAPFRDHHLERPSERRLAPDHPRYDEILRRHSRAVTDDQPCYADPATGLSVFTAPFLLERGYCCDSGCRHCPFVFD
jgi:uncharacterized protein DUF5522